MIDLKKGTKGASHAAGPKHTVKDIARFYLLLHGSLTRRDLSKYSGLEIATLCGALKALELEGVVHAPSTTTCATTGREVAVYTLKGIE